MKPPTLKVTVWKCEQHNVRKICLPDTYLNDAEQENIKRNKLMRSNHPHMGPTSNRLRSRAQYSHCTELWRCFSLKLLHNKRLIYVQMYMLGCTIYPLPCLLHFSVGILIARVTWHWQIFAYENAFSGGVCSHMFTSQVTKSITYEILIEWSVLNAGSEIYRWVFG